MDFLEIEVFLKKIINEVKHKPSNEFLHSYNLPFKIDLVNLLEICVSEKIYYYKSKYKSFEILAVGSYIKLKSSNDIAKFIKKNPQAIVCAPLKFEKDKNFYNETYVAEWTFVTENNNTRIIIANHNNTNQSSINLFFDYEIKNHIDYNAIEWSEMNEYPDQNQWSQILEQTKVFFRKKLIDKIVMYRTKIFDLKYPIEPRIIFNQLLKSNNHGADAYNIYFQENINTAFMSLSPEILFLLNNRNLESISLAGSTPRGNSQQLDLQFENKLIKDNKLRAEHEIVTKDIHSQLSKISESIEIGEVETMKLTYIQHNAQKINATINENVSVFDILETLHPTPAVGGSPKQSALDLIAEIEMVPRKFYAAPFGYISYHSSEFSVAIRSGFFQNQRLTIYGGAGILENSLAEDEWKETGVKMTPFLKVFNHV